MDTVDLSVLSNDELGAIAHMAAMGARIAHKMMQFDNYFRQMFGDTVVEDNPLPVLVTEDDAQNGSRFAMIVLQKGCDEETKIIRTDFSVATDIWTSISLMCNAAMTNIPAMLGEALGALRVTDDEAIVSAMEESFPGFYDMKSLTEAAIAKVNEGVSVTIPDTLPEDWS